MAMTTDRDDASLRRYRQASGALDERPSASTRAAILAAAARHVEAKPQAADAPRPLLRRRWPLAAAATVLLSTLAVMLASRTEQEMPRFATPEERVQENVPVARPGPAPHTSPTAPGVAAEAPSAPPSTAAPMAADSSATGVSSAESRLRKSAASVPPTTDERRSDVAGAAGRAELQVAPPPAPPARATDSAVTDSAKRTMPAAPPASAPALAAPEPAAVPSVGAAVTPAPRSSEAALPEAPAYGERKARREATPAPSTQGAVRQDAAANEAESSPQQWLERIVKLRSEGRHADADEELKRFRERYPEVRIPPAALSPAGAASGTR
jgi:hypothetical protein